MNKIIGFLITKENRSPEVDFFDVGIKTIVVKHGHHNIYLWGIGDIELHKINGKYSLSFPLNDGLLDRNILISFEGDNIIVENDWLGSIPVFYNQKENIVSTLSNFCLRDKKIHEEGLSNFCEFGYSVFEQTIFADVKFMRYYSTLTISDHAEIEYKEDPVLDDSFLADVSDENDVIDLMQKYITDVESVTVGDIVIPTSGGYDSRMLNHLVKDKKRIRSFTYGVSEDQSQSHEVAHAKKISEIYNTKWEQIELKEYHKYIDKWYKIYGFSTHLHGMYHIEFYKNISKGHDFSGSSFLSGIIGDAWAELGKFDEIENYHDIINLGYAHGMSLDLKYLNLQSNEKLKKEYYKRNCEYLKNDKIKSILAMRVKLILLSYLTQIPEYFGMPVWTPFLNFDIVKATLNISDERRKNRVWEKDFFARFGLNLEEMDLKSDKNNDLNYEVARKTRFEPIDADKMKKYIDENRLVQINKLLDNTNLYQSLQNKLLHVPKIRGVLQLCGVKNKFLRALYDYCVVKAIEKGIKDTQSYT
ncbi:MAG: hypothetical protein WC819_02715 [Parcubacteria group bacterium]|jgi:hypothetical protein